MKQWAIEADGRLYVLRDSNANRIIWTKDPEKATLFDTQKGADSVLRALEEICQQAKDITLLGQMQVIPIPEKSAEKIPEKSTEKVPEKPKEKVPENTSRGWHTADLNRGLRLLMRREKGEFRYALLDGTEIKDLGKNPRAALTEFFCKKRDECVAKVEGSGKNE